METFLCDFCVHRFPLFCQKNVFKSIFISKKRKKDSFPHTWSIYSSFPSGHFARLQKGSQLTLWGYCPMTTCPAHRHNTGHLVSSIIPMHLFKQMRSFTSLCRIRFKKKIVLTKPFQVTDISIQGKTPFEEVLAESSIFTHMRPSPLLMYNRQEAVWLDRTF